MSVFLQIDPNPNCGPLDVGRGFHRPSAQILPSTIEGDAAAIGAATLPLRAAFFDPYPDHVLNVRAANMSAYPDDPDHFWRWVGEHSSVDCPDAQSFAPRRLYRDYLASLPAARYSFFEVHEQDGG